MHFRLLSYNIHKGIGGVDRRHKLDRIIETVNYYAPDIAVLQEVDEGVPRTKQERQAEVLSGETGLEHFAYQRNVSLKVGHYGNAILSRWPLHETSSVDLSIRLKKRRGAMVASCRIPGRSETHRVVLANIHLGLSGLERRMQLRRLLAAECMVHVRRTTPLVIAGDYNDVWSSLGWLVMRKEGFVAAGKRIRTFPAAMPLRALDRVFYRGEIRALHTFAGHTETARRASDHLPLVVDFELT
ncbi:MAG TPA: endonuclease/exonuclease/phosphatase family protein [Lacipirellulaceae bacterium]|jgi:endonuclease/exonuclease/phosphatase family metal-dependent hydrolase